MTSKRINNHLFQQRRYLKVYISYVLKMIRLQFDVDEKEKVARIYLSAEATNMFKEVRGKGQINFKSFIVD